MPLFIVFVDFTEAFSTFNQLLLAVDNAKEISCLEMFVNVVTSLVRFKVELSDAFELNNGVKQGCVLAPTLFSVFLSLVLHHVFTNHNREVWIQTQPFTDVTAFVTYTHQDTQEITTLFAEVAKAFELKININKTEVVYQPAPGCHTEDDPILLED